MRKILMAGLVIAAVVSVAPRAATACPNCVDGIGWCVGQTQNTNVTWCLQGYNPDLSPYCTVSVGLCQWNESLLDVERLAPDGSLRAIFAATPEFQVVGSDPMHPVAVYEVAGCRSYVVSREYEPIEALARRERTADIVI